MSSAADPLSFFAGDDSSDSESENETSEARKSDPISSSSSSVSTSTTSHKLPAPDTLFASVGRPSFLNKSTQRQVNWDNFVKNDTEPFEPNIHLSGGPGKNYAAIAPPKELNDETSSKKMVHSSLTAAIVNTYSNTGGEISSPPVRYTTEDVDPKFRTVSDEGTVSGGSASEIPPKPGKHGLCDPMEELEGSSKKQKKTENFRQKEKRKRDSGQTSRGKSYVEEEKRVLRQHFGADEVMS